MKIPFLFTGENFLRLDRFFSSILKTLEKEFFSTTKDSPYSSCSTWTKQMELELEISFRQKCILKFVHYLGIYVLSVACNCTKIAYCCCKGKLDPFILPISPW